MGEMVTIERGEYDRLLAAEEDLADLRAYDRAMAALSTGDDELVPAEFANRILAGESPLRVYRDLRRITQQQLSAVSGVNRVQISDIEAGRSAGSVATVKRLAEALGVAVDDLV